MILVAWCGCAVASAGDLGRLFTTAQERSALDGNPAARASRPPPAVRLQGIVARQGGDPAAFIRDRTLRRGDAGAGFVLLDADRDGALILRRRVGEKKTGGGEP